MLGRMPNAVELAVALGRRIPMTAFGEVALVAKIAPTLRDALRILVDFHHDLVPLMTYSYQESETEGRITSAFAVRSAAGARRCW
jgi:hypothetical protein